MQARALLASGLMAVVLAGCSDKAAELGAQWGCGPIDGLAQFKGPPPKFVLVGEFIETNEAPAAFAELACHLAARQAPNEGPLFVGISEYLGGATDAETKMHARLEALAAKGAPIAIGAIGGEDRPYSVRQRSAVEKEWAKAIETKVADAGSRRALLLMPRTDAMAAPIPRKGDRFAGYDPMATFLPEGEVLALEIRTTPQAGVSAPAIRLYPDMADGFHGQIALGSLTRPLVAMLMPAADGRSQAEAAGQVVSVDKSGGVYGFSLSLDELRVLARPDMTREQKIAAVTAVLAARYETDQPGDPPSRKQLRLPPRKLAEILVDEVSRRDTPSVTLETPQPQLDLPEFEVEDPPPD